MQRDVNWPLGWPVGGYPGPQVLYQEASFTIQKINLRLAEIHFLVKHCWVVILCWNIAGSILLRRGIRQVIWPWHIGCSLQGMPLRWNWNQWNKRGGHAWSGEPLYLYVRMYSYFVWTRDVFYIFFQMKVEVFNRWNFTNLIHAVGVPGWT
jgi:hypothetical protein